MNNSADNAPTNAGEPRWPLPANPLKSDGSPRRVGVEFEFQGIGISDLATLTASTLGGTLSETSQAEYNVSVQGQGDFRVEVDYALLKKAAKAQGEDDGSLGHRVDAIAVDLLSAASAALVPCEVVAPPLPMAELAAPMDALVEAIRLAGGEGTRRSPLYAFGVHLNVEPPSLEAHSVTAYLKAFVCLFDWLVHDGEVDLARRLTPYIQKFPSDYERLLAQPAYWPDWDTLVIDYLRANPTRNRALDMLPMLSEINPAAVELVVNDDRVNARPAFHYRLANCLIDEPDWSIAAPWRRWLVIEHLASDTDLLNALCAEFVSDRDRVMHKIDGAWREHVADLVATW